MGCRCFAGATHTQLLVCGNRAFGIESGIFVGIAYTAYFASGSVGITMLK
jgi:hypothetical protein